MKKSTLFLFSFALSFQIFAQALTFEQIRPLAPAPTIVADFERVKNGSVAFADIDNDGDQDALVTGENSSYQKIAKLYTNDGTGNYTLVTGTPFAGVNHSSIAFADVDNDMDLDVLITGRYNSSQAIAKLYTNNGNGNYILATGTPFDGVWNGSITFADVDNDNDQDVLITGGNSTGAIAKLYANNGMGSFSLVTGTPFDGVSESAIAFADVDNDNDQDVLITGGNNSSQSIAKLYTNNGTGNFTLVTGAPFEGVKISSIAFADVDNDSDLDVLITGYNDSIQRTAKLYTNNGTGSYSLVTGTPFDDITNGSIAFADVDNDNDQDVLITGSGSPAFVAKLYTNNGLGNFTLVAATHFDGVAKSSIAFADLDNDMDQDLLITGENNSN